MPNIPRKLREITPKPVGKAPLPVGAARTAEGAIGQGLQQLGGGIENIGRSLFQIEQEKQRIRDNALIASANSNRNQAIADSIDLAKRTDFTDIKQFFDFREQVKVDLDLIEQNSLSKMSKRAASAYNNYTKNNRQSALRQIESIIWQKEVEFQRNDTKRQYTNEFENMAEAGFTVEEMKDSRSLDIIEAGMSPYWAEGELERERDTALIYALANKHRYDDARNYVESINTLTPQEKTSRLHHINVLEAQTISKLRKADDVRIESIEQLFFSDFINENLSIDQVEIADVPTNVKLRWRSLLEAQRKAIVDGTDLQTDYRLKVDLEDMAINLRQGTMTMPVFREAVARARAERRLEDNDYEAVMDLARREFRAGQLETMNDRFKANLSQLVDLPSEYDLRERLRGLKSTEHEPIISLRKLQLKNYDNYKQALLRFHKEKPGATIEELYNEGERLLSVYKRTPAQLRAETVPTVEFRATEDELHKMFQEASEADSLREMKEGIEGKKPASEENQLQYIKILFNLTDDEFKTVQQWRKSGHTFDRIMRILNSRIDR